MSRINRPPLGLQQILGSQNFGVNPTELKQDVQPTVDLLPFYGAGLLRGEEFVGSRNSEGLIGAIIPTSRFMLVGASCWCISSASGTLSPAVLLSGIAGDDPQNPHVLFRNNRDTVNTTNVASAGGILPFPIVFEQGAAIEFWWFANTASDTANLNCRVLYYDLDPQG